MIMDVESFRSVLATEQVDEVEMILEKIEEDEVHNVFHSIKE
jgi:hypothetical protein